MYNCFQPLKVCLSYSGTIAQMKRVAKDYDANGGADGRESEPGDGDEELGLID